MSAAHGGKEGQCGGVARRFLGRASSLKAETTSRYSRVCVTEDSGHLVLHGEQRIQAVPHPSRRPLPPPHLK